MNSKQGYLHRGNFRTGGETIIAKACRTALGFAATYTVQLTPKSTCKKYFVNKKHR
jgi:hypothetical protein